MIAPVVVGMSGAIAVASAAAATPDPSIQPLPPSMGNSSAQGAAIDVSGTLSAVSDYRFRGVSATAGDPALQASVEIAGKNGLYAGLWASTLNPTIHDGVEADIYGGYRMSRSGLDFDFGLVSYTYYRPRHTSVAELYGSVGKAFGNQSIKVGSYCAPAQKGLGTLSGIYVFADYSNASLKLATVHVHTGYERGGATPNGAPKIDWLIGSDFPIGPLTATLALTGAEYRGRQRSDYAGPKMLFAVGASF